MKQLRDFVTGVGLVLLLSGCFVTKRGPRFDAYDKSNLTTLTNLTAAGGTNQIRKEWLTASQDFYRLGPGDRLEIEIGDEPTSRANTVVAPDGKIYYYLLPGVDVWGLTLPETKARLEQELRMYYSQPKEVLLQLRSIDSARVWVLGRVRNAGVYPIGAPMTLLEAITLAGGTMTSEATGTTEDLGDLRNSFVIRNGQRLPIDFEALLVRGDMRQNIYLEPDDFIYVPSSLSRDIYVLGAVRQPKAVPRYQGTLVAAIAEAGGPVKNAHVREVAVVRGSLSNPRIAVVDYEKIVKGKAPDVVLEPRDIVFVPHSPYRYLSRYLDLIVTTFVRAVAINEGSRAAGGNVAAGVTIPIGFPLGTVPVVPIPAR